jgi:hypothetical protein
MNSRSASHSIADKVIRAVLASVVLASVIILVACGGSSQDQSATTKYPSGISEDVEQQLKYDARVESVESGDNDSLIVNVNEGWLNSPPGMQERSLGQWFTMWHSSHSGGVIVQHAGNKIASWTSQDGYKPEPKAGSDQTKSEG